MAVLLLDASLQPLNVISDRRLTALLSKGRVAFLDDRGANEASMAFSERRFPHGILLARLMRSIRVPRKRLRPNRRNLLLRDGAVCQYCGHAGPAGEMTVDHIVPLSKGGASDRWENLVIACRRCNWRKANRTPAEVGMKLRRRPRALVQEYSQVLLMRYPELKAAYEMLIEPAA